MTNLEMIEPFGVPDVYVDGLGSIEDLEGGNVRCQFFTLQAFAGQQQRVVTCKLVGSVSTVPRTLLMAAKHIGMKWHGEDFPQLHLH